MPVPFKTAFQPLLRQLPLQTTIEDGVRTELYNVTAHKGQARSLNNYLAPVIGYNGKVPGQYISVERGTKVRLGVRNGLDLTGGHEGDGDALSTHLHGHASLPEYDGYADDRTMPGYYKKYV